MTGKRSSTSSRSQKPASSATTSAAHESGNEAKLSKYQRFRPVTVHRSQIKEADYNPRIIDKHARKKLKENIQRNGLVDTIVWNKRTGHIVGGHQRIGVIDELQGTQDYELTVAEIDVDEKQEKVLNVFLNNSSAQGNWDLEALQKLILDVDGDRDKLGFDRVDLDFMFPNGELGSIFAQEKPQAVSDIEKLHEMRDSLKEPATGSGSETKSGGNETATSGSETPSNGSQTSQVSESDAMRAQKASYRERATAADDTEFYVIVVFEDKRTTDAFLRGAKLPLDERYVDGRKLATMLDIDLG